MASVEIYIARHGETEWNRQGRFQGQQDSRLAEEGRTQARLLGQSLRHLRFDRVYTSPSGRTQETTALILETFTPPPPVILAPALMEIRHGDWEGLTWREVDERWPELHNTYREEPHKFEGAPGGERLAEVEERAVAFLNATASEAGADDVVLMVTHGVTSKLMVGSVLGRSIGDLWTPPRMDPTGLSQLHYEDGRFTVVRFADRSHLEAPN